MGLLNTYLEFQFVDTAAPKQAMPKQQRCLGIDVKDALREFPVLPG